MRNFSVQEIEALGKVIGKSFREQYGFIKDESTVKNLINATVRDLLQKSMSRRAPWLEPLSPIDIFNIEKRLYEPTGQDEVSKKLQDLNDDTYILMKALNTEPRNLRSYGDLTKRWGELRKALNTATSGEGLEWIPEGFSNTLIEMVELEAVVATLFQSFRMPTPTYKFPMLLEDGEAYLGGEATNDNPDDYNASTARTGRLTFTAIKMISRNVVTEEMEEDSIVPVLPMYKKSIARAHAKAKDNAIINGDTSTTHQDTGHNVTADDARKAWPGLRKLTMSSLKQSGSTWSTSAGLGLFRALRESMGVRGLASKDLAILANVIMMGKFKNVAEVNTRDKIGDVATVVSGEIKKFDGVDIVPTQHVEESQNTSGIYDGATTTTTQYLLVHRPSFMMGIRREFTIELVRKPEKGVNLLVATSRCHWKNVYDEATEPIVGWQYNVTK